MAKLGLDWSQLVSSRLSLKTQGLLPRDWVETKSESQRRCLVLSRCLDGFDQCYQASELCAVDKSQKLRLQLNNFFGMPWTAELAAAGCGSSMWPPPLHLSRLLALCLQGGGHIVQLDFNPNADSCARLLHQCDCVWRTISVARHNEFVRRTSNRTLVNAIRTMLAWTGASRTWPGRAWRDWGKAIERPQFLQRQTCKQLTPIVRRNSNTI